MMTVKIISEDEEEKDRDNADIRMPAIRTILGPSVVMMSMVTITMNAVLVIFQSVEARGTQQRGEQ